MNQPVWEVGMNDEQLAVIRHEHGPCRVLAGPGSGKTRAVVHRVARLVAEGVRPERIFCVTFSKAGANEMMARLKKLGCRSVTVQTWHAFCKRVIDEDGLRGADWTVDEKDKAKQLVKKAVGYQHVDWKGADLGEIRRFIGACKANLFTPDSEGAEELARERFGISAAKAIRVYSVSQELIEEAQLLTFDDMLVYVAEHFAENEEARASWAARFDFVLVDERQDNNRVQVVTERHLSADHRNLMTVGDLAQCIPEGELVSTPDGYRAIETIQVGDFVHSVKAGLLVSARVVRTSCNKKTEAIEFNVASVGNSVGKIKATAEHVMFAAISDPGGSFVYLMYRHDLGFRIGVSRTVGHNGKYFVVRTQQENAERLWVLRWCATYAEAAELESEWAYAFGIPREPFVPRPDTWGDGDAIKRLFSKFGANGRALLDAAGLDFERPNYFAKATARGRIAVNILMATKDGHRVEVDTGIADRARCAMLGMTLTSRGTMRTRRCFRSLREARACAQQFAGTLGGYVTESLSGTGSKRRMRAVRAASVHVGMEVPVVVDGQLKSAKVTGRRVVPAALTYDLEVEDHGNFIVGGVVVHNCIYAFRGAQPEFFHRFDQEWEGATTITLSRNYRSGDRIVAVVNEVIRPAEMRMPEDIIPMRGVAGQVELVDCNTLEDEAREMVSMVEREIAGGRSPSDVCVLFRLNAQSRALEEALLKARLPYIIVGGTNFYERKEVKDLLAYLRVAVGHDPDGDAVRRCINAPFRFLGNAFVERVMNLAANARAMLAEDEQVSWLGIVEQAAQQAGIQRRQVEAAKNWVATIDEIRAHISRWSPGCGETSASVIGELVSKLRYIEWLDKEEGAESVENSHAANVREIVRVAGAFPRVTDLLSYVDEQVASAERHKRERKGEAVTLMSIHKSKGLEWPIVWVVGCNEDVLPHFRGEIEEERRLMYVAASRARDSLYLSYVREMMTRRGLKQMEPSQFLERMPEGVLRRATDKAARQWAKRAFDAGPASVSVHSEPKTTCVKCDCSPCCCA